MTDLPDVNVWLALVDVRRRFPQVQDRARLVYLAELPNFDFAVFNDILARHGLCAQWHQWASALGLKH